MAGNKRKQWGVAVGNPFDTYRGRVDMKNVGIFCEDFFFTKSAAAICAARQEAFKVWHYHAMKFIPNRDAK